APAYASRDRSWRSAFGPLEKGDDVRPERLPLLPFILHELGELLFIAEARQVGILPPMAQRPGNRCSLWCVCAFKQPGPIGEIGCEPLLGLLAQLRGRSRSGSPVVLASTGGCKRSRAGGAVADLVITVRRERWIGVDRLAPEPHGSPVETAIIAHLGDSQ